MGGWLVMVVGVADDSSIQTELSTILGTVFQES